MKKPPNKSLPGSPQEWLNHAKSDLALARLGTTAEDVLPELICFHAQQAVEKSLKAVLLHNNIRFPLIHDLETLVEIAQHEGLTLPTWADEVADLTPYAAETRYPGHWEDFQENEVVSALDTAQKVIKWASSIIKPHSHPRKL
jgi:HEPN domain-containing protein